MSSERLAESQDARRRPKLEIRQLEAHGEKPTEEMRRFAFRIQIANLSEVPNTVARLELCVRFTRDLPLSIRVDPVRPEEHRQPALNAPLRLDGHHTAEGWCCFELPESVLQDAAITSYAVIATDTHQKETIMEAFVLLGGVR